MKPLTPIRDDNQYFAYCDELEVLGETEEITQEIENRIEHLLILIEAWDNQHSNVTDLNPVEYLRLLMQENNVSYSDLEDIGIKKYQVSHILNYRRGFSKKTIAILSNYFKVSQEAFNREYKLQSPNKEIPFFKEVKIVNLKKYRKKTIFYGGKVYEKAECLNQEKEEIHESKPLIVVGFS